MSETRKPELPAETLNQAHSDYDPTPPEGTVGDIVDSWIDHFSEGLRSAMISFQKKSPEDKVKVVVAGAVGLYLLGRLFSNSSRGQTRN
jgi:hypothetical protein